MIINSNSNCRVMPCTLDPSVKGSRMKTVCSLIQVRAWRTTSPMRMEMEYIFPTPSSSLFSIRMTVFPVPKR